MTIPEKLQDAFASAQNYPDLAARLAAAGVLSYTVDVASKITLYRFENGVIHLSEKTDAPVAISPQFDKGAVVKAIRDNQEGRTTYPEFMQGMANSGVIFYEATLNGENPRVTYIGIGGFYEEVIPV